MDNCFNTPAEVVELNMKGGEGKASMPLLKMILMGIMAGAFIALGGATSSTAAHNIADVGLARLVSGCIFPLGLMAIVLVGGELFTGNCLIIMDVFAGRVKVSALLKDLVVVFFSNFIGALIIDFLIYFSGNLNYSAGKLGAYAIKVAIAKADLDFVTGFTSGILCNTLVCLAILMAASAKDIGGKIWAIFFPIMAFVVGGFEHCVANMFYIPVGIIAKMNPLYVEAAQKMYGLSAEKIADLGIMGLCNNLAAVTLGNIVGGMVVVGAACYLSYKHKWEKPNT